MTAPPPSRPRLVDVAASVAAREPARLRELLALVDAGLDAVDPELAVAAALTPHRPKLAGATVIALGKAAPAMARGAARALPEGVGRLVVVTDHPEPVPAGAEILVTSHPLPDDRSLAAGRLLLEVVAASAQPILFLISGGGSALAEVPGPGLSLADVTATYAAMLRVPLTIEEANTVRSHLSRLKGGRLAAAARVPVLSLLVSDVGPHPHLIASGPTVACRSSPADALAVIRRHHLEVPGSVVAYLATAGPPPALQPAPVVTAADGATAAAAAAAAGRRRHLPVTVVATDLAGEARRAAREVIAATPPGQIGIFAGETTVAVRGEGAGGRNQEGALAAAAVLDGTDSALLTFGTDGVDGPTDAAGGYVDGSTGAALRAAGIDVDATLAENDSHTALASIGAVVRTGPTGMNVADLWVVDRRRSGSGGP